MYYLKKAGVPFEVTAAGGRFLEAPVSGTYLFAGLRYHVSSSKCTATSGLLRRSGDRVLLLISEAAAQRKPR